MKRLASIIGSKVERIPRYLDARRQQTEAMANPSPLVFLRKLDLLPETTQTKLAATPPIEASEKPAEGFFDKLGKLTEVAAPVAALMGEPEAAAAVTVIDEAVTKLQTVLAKPKAGKTDEAKSDSTKTSSPARSRVEEVSASNEMSPETSESEAANATPDRSPQAWAARIRKMIEAEAGAVERQLPEIPMVSNAQTQLVKAAESIGSVSSIPTIAIPVLAPASAALAEARRFVPPIVGSDSLSQAVQQPIGQAVQQATAAIPFSMQTAANFESSIEENVSNVIAPIAETIESPTALINQQVTQPGTQVVNQPNGAAQQAMSLTMPTVESLADFAGSIAPRFVPPIPTSISPAIPGATLPAQDQQAMPQMSLPSGVESLANDAIQSAAQSGEALLAQSGLAAAAGEGLASETLAGVARSLFGQAEESIESSISAPVKTLEQWAQQTANLGGDFSGLFGQSEPSPTTIAKSKQSETVAAARHERDDGEKIKKAPRATSAQVAPDLDDIARQVYPILKRRLDAERRRELF